MLSASRAAVPVQNPTVRVGGCHARTAAAAVRGEARPHVHRRECLAIITLLSSGSCMAHNAAPAQADEEYTAPLPKDFVKLARELINALRAPIELEQMGAKEAEVRQKASSASGPVREFLQKWKGNPRVEQTVVHQELLRTIEELGQFYIKYGQRTPLDKQTSESLIHHLDAAELELPIEPEKPGLFGGIFSALN